MNQLLLRPPACSLDSISAALSCLVCVPPREVKCLQGRSAGSFPGQRLVIEVTCSLAPCFFDLTASEKERKRLLSRLLLHLSTLDSDKPKNIGVKIPKFDKSACCEKYLKDNNHNTLHLAPKYVRIFVHKPIICSEKPTV